MERTGRDKGKKDFRRDESGGEAETDQKRSKYIWEWQGK
jgi:hypothetical protein